MTGLNVDITADTRQFQAQVENVPTELQKISDQLQQVTQEGDKAGSSLEGSMRTAQQQTANSEQVFRSYTDHVVAGTQKQTEAFGLSNTEINRAQREGLKATGAALTQTVAQSAQAFDGTVNGALSAVSNISTGVAAFGGPEVAAIAGGVALLTSVVSGLFNGAKQDAAQFQAQVSSLTDSMISSGDGLAAQETRYNAAVKSYTDGTNTLGYSFDTMRDKATSLGVPLDTLIAAYSGNAKAADEVRTASNRVVDSFHEVTTSAAAQRTAVSHAAIAQHDNAVAAISDLRGVTDAQAAAAKGAQEYGRLQTQAAQDAAAAQKVYSDAVSASFDNIGSTLASAEDQINSKIASAQQALDTAVAASAGKRTKAVIAAQKALTDAQNQQNQDTAAAFLDQQNKDIANLEKASAAKITIYEKFGSDAAALIKSAGDNTNLLQSLAGADPGTVSKILANYGRLGKDAATNLQSEAQKYLDGQELSIRRAKLQVDTSEVDAALKKYASAPFTINLQAKVTQFGRNTP